MSSVKKRWVRAGTVTALFACSPAGFAGVGHYLPGMFNIRDFFVPEDKGVYTAVYYGNYSADTINDKDGNGVSTVTATVNGPGGMGSATATANLKTSININIAAPVIMWNTGYKVLGADYAMYIAVPFANNSLGASFDALVDVSVGGFSASRSASASATSNTFGISDIYVQPLWLDWRGKHYDVSTGYGFYAPTGNYSPTGGANNIGLGYWSHQLQLAGAYYPFDNKGTALTLAGTYEINQKKAGIDFTQGSHFTLNWGLSQYLPITKDVLLEVGPAGYSQWQVSDNQGSAQPLFLNTNNEVHAAGGQIGVAVPKIKAKVSFHYFAEFDAQARPLGNYLGATAAVGF